MGITKGIISEWVSSQDFTATVKAKKALTVKNLINLDFEAMVKSWINLEKIQFWILDL